MKVMMKLIYIKCQRVVCLLQNEHFSGRFPPEPQQAMWDTKNHHFLKMSSKVLKARSPKGKELQLDVLHLLSPVVKQSTPRPDHCIVDPSPIVRHDICPKFYITRFSCWWYLSKTLHNRIFMQMMIAAGTWAPRPRTGREARMPRIYYLLLFIILYFYIYIFIFFIFFDCCWHLGTEATRREARMPRMRFGPNSWVVACHTLPCDNHQWHHHHHYH